MMSTIRRHMKSKGFQLLIWISLASLLGGFGLTQMLRNFFKKGVEGIASVDGYDISFMEFQRTNLRTAEIIKQINKQFGDFAKEILSMYGLSGDKKPYEIALDRLIQEKAIQKNADAVVKAISKDFIKAKLNDPYFISQSLSDLIPAQAIERGRLNANILMSYLQRQGISEDEFENIVIGTLKRDLFLNLVKSAVYIPEFYLKERYNKEYSKKKYKLTSMPMEKYIKSAQSEKLTDEEIQKYFDAHKENYRISEKRSGILWSFKPENYGLVVSDKEIGDYYNGHKGTFIATPAQLKIKRILVRFKKFDADKEKSQLEARKEIQAIEEKIKANPNLFDQFALKDIITLKKGYKEPLIEKAAFAIAAPSGISGIIKTTEGFEIIKLIEKKDAEFKNLETVKNDIKKKLLAKKFETIFNTDAHRVLIQIKDNPELFVNYVENKEGSKEKLGPIEKAIASIRSDKLFKLDKIGSRSFFVEEGTGYIIELSAIEKSSIPNLSDVKDKVVSDLYKFKARNKLNEDLKDEKKLTALKAKSITTDWIDLDNKESLKIFKEKELPINIVSSLTKENEKTEFLTDKEGFVVELVEIAPFNKDEYDKKKSMIARQLEQIMLRDVSESFIKYIVQKANIKKNEELLRKTSRVEL